MADDSKWYAKRSDIYHVPLDDIHVICGWNEREDWDLEPLCATLRANGIYGIPPLVITRDKEGSVELRDGERRLRALRLVRNEGYPVTIVPCVLDIDPATKRRPSEADMLMRMYLSNTGKPFTAMEEARTFRRFLIWEWTPEDIARKMGKSLSTVRNSLALLDAAPAVVTALQEGIISKSEAVAVVREAHRTDEEQATVVERRQTAKREKKAAPRDETAPAERDASTLRRLVATNGIDWAVALLVQDAGAEAIIDAVHEAKNLAHTS